MKTRFSVEFLEHSTGVLRAIAHPVRLSIVDVIYKNERVTQSELVEELEIEIAVLNHHLNILLSKNILKQLGENGKVEYELKDEIYYGILNILTTT